MLLSITNISKSYGANQALNQVSLTLATGQKVGLVGANGVGKSTLLKIIVGEVEPDDGDVTIPAGVSIGYLPQVLASAGSQTVTELIDAALGNLTVLEQRLRKLEATMQQPNGQLDALLVEYSALTEQFERRGGYDLAHRLDVVMVGLAVAHIARNRLVSTLSGGEKSRVGLAALLLRGDDLLLLDEPTNHLDFAALEWLENFLCDFKGGLLLVSHDRQFLNQTVNTIVEIEEHSRAAKVYSGSYDFYAEVKVRQHQQWIIDYAAQQAEIIELRKLIKTKANQNPFARARRDNDKFAYTFKTEKLQSSIARNLRNAEEKLHRIEEDPIPKPPSELTINPEFNPTQLANKSPLTVTGIRKSFGNQLVLDGIDCAISAESRIVIIGHNGTGKSTLLKIMAGVETPDAGEVFWAASVALGHLDQEQETLQVEGTLVDAYRASRLGEWEEMKRELLSYGLFAWSDLLKPVAALSVGQKRKLQIAQLIAHKANLLLLDEPTNHISFDVLEEFERALLKFPGPVIAISHDRRFIERFANEVWEIRAGRLIQNVRIEKRV